MNLEQKLVMEFHSLFDIPIGLKPNLIDPIARTRRFALMAEELLELNTAMANEDIVGIADGLADLLYVVYGTAIEYGLDMEPIFNEVHRSNMTKIGGYKNIFGKWIKPPTYSPADLKSILDKLSK